MFTAYWTHFILFIGKGNVALILLRILKKDNIWGSLNKFPDFFRMGTFIDNTHVKPLSPSK